MLHLLNHQVIWESPRNAQKLLWIALPNLIHYRSFELNRWCSRKEEALTVEFFRHTEFKEGLGDGGL